MSRATMTPLRVAAPIRRVRSTPRVSATAPHAFVDGHVSGSVAPPASVVALRRRAAAGAAAVAVALSAHALPADAKLVNVSIDQASLTSRVCDDPRAGGVPGTATYKAKCMGFLGVAVNPSSETVYNADVYGQVKDNANDDVLNSGRVGSIAKLAPGPNDFRLQLTVANSQPLPLKLKAFKAQGVTRSSTPARIRTTITPISTISARKSEAPRRRIKTRGDECEEEIRRVPRVPAAAPSSPLFVARACAFSDLLTTRTPARRAWASPRTPSRVSRPPPPRAVPPDPSPVVRSCELRGVHSHLPSVDSHTAKAPSPGPAYGAGDVVLQRISHRDRLLSPRAVISMIVSYITAEGLPMRWMAP